jgi:large subunit ribosomal protein L28
MCYHSFPLGYWKGNQLSNVCDICGKKPQFGFNVSHSHKKTKRRWTPNVHKMRIVINGSPRNARVCSKCLKAGKVQKA